MSAWFTTRAPVAFKNIVTDYGAVADGVTDCSTAFTNFRTYARTQTDLVHLTIPPGSYVVNVSTIPAPFSGIDNLVVSGYGATLKFTSTIYVTARAGFVQAVDKSARVQTVTAGQQVVTLVTPAQTSFFAVDDWCCLAALEMQGTAGFPPNLHYNEFLKISNISDGVISFTTPVGQDYSSLFPESTTYPSLPSSGYDSGGPATLFLMGSSNGDPAGAWDTQVKIYGLTFNNTGSGTQVYSPGRDVRYVECTFTNCSPIPSATKFWSATRIVATDIQIEIDKDVEYAEFIGCTLKSFHCQSSSITQLVVDGCTLTTAFNGTPRRLLLKGACSIPSLQCGVAGYGATEEIIIQSPVVISALTVNDSDRSAYGNFTQSGGDLTYTGAVGTPLPIGIPGTILSLGTNTRASGYGSLVSSVTASGYEPVLHTSFADPLPALPAAWGTPSYVKQHPCLAITVASGVTGCPQIVALAGGVAGEPLYSNLDYTSDWISPPTLRIRGLLVSITIQVITAYTGAQSTALLHVGGTFNNFPARLADGTAGVFAPIVNTKIVGTRVITPTTVTGAQTGDTLGSAPGDIWLVDFGGLTPILSGSFGGDTADKYPSVRIIIATDQAP